MANPNFLYREHCPICARGNLSIVFSTPFSNPTLWKSISDQYGKLTVVNDWADTPFSITHCTSCDFYFTQYIPSDEFYERITLRQTPTGVLPEREKKMGIRHYARLAFECEKISSLVQRVPNAISVLEFGSGFGHWLLMAKAFNYQTVGIEIYEDRIAYAEKNALTIHRSLTNIPDESIDFIFSNQVFEHLNDPLPILQNLVKKLHPAGLVQIGVPEARNIKQVISQYQRHGTVDKLIAPIGHINCFPNTALVALAEKSGLVRVPPSLLRKRYFHTMTENGDVRYLREILLAGYKQNNSSYLYFQKSKSLL